MDIAKGPFFQNQKEVVTWYDNVTWSSVMRLNCRVSNLSTAEIWDITVSHALPVSSHPCNIAKHSCTSLATDIPVRYRGLREERSNKVTYEDTV